MKRLYIIGILSVLISLGLATRLYFLGEGDTFTSTGGGYVSLNIDGGYGNIYDRNFVSFTNNESVYSAVISSPEKKPVITEVSSPEADGIYVFETKKRYSENTASHIIGYNSGETSTGIEKAYESFLKNQSASGRISFPSNAKGQILDGLDFDVILPAPIKSGVILTLDKNISEIVQEAARANALTKGAVVIMNMDGDIIAAESFPNFDRDNIEAYTNAPDSPLFNRAFAPSAVGSVFKLTAAAEALEEGITPEYTYNCKGYIDVKGVRFNCHSWAGHGVIDIREAIVYSCNPFFIALGNDISLTKYLSSLKAYGFGKNSTLAPGLSSSSGNLPTAKELLVPAERANLSFGQGKLTATPLQICRFTVAIANGGLLPSPRLVIGLTDDIDEAEVKPNPVSPVRVMSEDTSKFLTSSMVDTINTSVRTAIPSNVTAAGKTSTAQTGHFKTGGAEIVQVWFTGFFPADNPKYAVTVLCEDGVSGTLTAAPVFKEIAEKITAREI
jgi:penicillin-binding protein 2